MDSGFVDLDILLTRIRHAQSKAYFLDAVKSYKAGALRASLTAAWVALVYDLIAKYRKLDALGDGAATAAHRHLENRQDLPLLHLRNLRQQRQNGLQGPLDPDGQTRRSCHVELN